MQIRTLSLALVLMACGKADDTGSSDGPSGDTQSGGSAGAVDMDQDGYTDDVDCDDTNSLIHPDADEICDGLDNNCDAFIDDSSAVDARSWYPDLDGDGYAACQECNDYNAAINPSADEVCSDVLDNDCDGLTDDASAVDATTWYIDYDGDGYGNDTTDYTQVACDQPDGFVDNSDDCIDTDENSYPGADEVCDGYDNNCDDTIDEPTAVDASTWYYDSDLDGFGDPDTFQVACTQPSGYLEDSSDCDDSLASVNPTADEVCDEIDNDCDSLIDDDDSSITDQTLWYADADEDNYGNPGDTTLACEQPAGFGANQGDCDDTRDDINPGADELCDVYYDNDCDGNTDEASAIDAIEWYADADSDGFGDLDTTTFDCDQPEGFVANSTDCNDSESAISPDADEICNDGIDNDCDSGASEVCSMEAQSADSSYIGEASGDRAGFRIVNAGDLDEDGIDDIAISSRYANSSTGSVYIRFSPLAPEGEVSLSTMDMFIDGNATGELLGTNILSDADLNDDGHLDLLITAPWYDPGSDPTKSSSSVPKAGGAYVMYGPFSPGSLNAADSDLFFLGEKSYNETGIGAAILGDMNDDSYTDIILGAYADDDSAGNSGTSYVMYGPLGTGEFNLDDATDTIVGENASDLSGARISWVGDINADGFDDVVMGVKKSDPNGTDSGTVYAIFGPVSGELSLGDADVSLYGADASDLLGEHVTALDDFDADGYADFAVGAPGEDSGATNGGALFLISGQGAASVSGSDITVADVVVQGVDAELKMGTSAAGYDDVNMDGENDLLIGATVSGAGGGAFLFYGGFTPGTTLTHEDADVFFLSDDSSDTVGVQVEFSGDLTGSGQPAILIGNDTDSVGGTEAGAAYVIFGIDL